MYAKDVEQYLIENTGMHPLKHICCYWVNIGDYGETGFNGKIPNRLWNIDGVTPYFYISMLSGEEFGKTDWKDIEWFYVYVKAELESP